MSLTRYDNCEIYKHADRERDHIRDRKYTRSRFAPLVRAALNSAGVWFIYNINVIFNVKYS